MFITPSLLTLSPTSSATLTFRDETRQLRIRLDAQTLDRVSVIQEWLKGQGKPTSLEYVCGYALNALYDELELEGEVQPNA